MSDFLIRTVDFGQGERLPLLVRKSTQIGIFEVASFALQMRSNFLEVKTIDSAVRAIQLLYEVLDEEKIDLFERAENSELLRESEIKNVTDRCKIRKSAIAKLAEGVTPIARARLKKRKFTIAKSDAVLPKTAVIKLNYIHQFLSSFSDYVLLQKIPKDPAEFREASRLTLRVLKKNKPTNHRVSKKRGLTREAEKLLFEVTDPNFSGNPWKTVFLRQRNYLILQLLNGLGLRKGELLSVKLEDINFRASRIFIPKRPDDEDDKRGRQAKSKTMARELPLTDGMVQLLMHYIDKVRATTKRAKYHPFLIVADTGDALALNSIDNLFLNIRQAYPEFVQLHAHILRHTINDRLAELYNNADPGLKQQVTNYLMGWSADSKMVENYTKGYVEEQGKGALLSLQNKIFKIT